MPADMFHDVAFGIYITVDAVSNSKEKIQIEKRLEDAGFSEHFDPMESYGRRLDEFDAGVCKFFCK